jgi:hypothetical protein
VKCIGKVVKYMWLLLILVISSNPYLKSQDTAQAVLTSYDLIDVCGSSQEKVYTISIGIGEVKPSDSLFGFNFWVHYNPQKFTFSSGLYTGTLAEFFDNKAVLVRDSGVISGYAGSFSINASGNLPLIAFTGRFIGVCPDSDYFRLDTITFTDGFKKNVNVSGKYVLVKAEVLDKPERSMTASFDKDTIEFNKADSTGEVIAKFAVNDTMRLENADFELTIDDTVNFRIDSIEALTDKIQIDSIKAIDKGFLIKTTILNNINNENLFRIKLKELVQNGGIKGLKIKPVKVNDCACIIRLIEADANIKGTEKHDTTGLKTDEEENYKSLNGYFDYGNNRFIINSNKKIKEIIMYNLIGNIVRTVQDPGNSDKIGIDAAGLTDGVYILISIDIEKELNKIVMIKN